jgi:septum formation protein
MNLILASASARRKELLSWLVDDFTIIPSQIDEDKYIALARTPEELVVKLSLAKGREIMENHSQAYGTIILSSDTVVVLRENSSWQVLGKPENLIQAKIMLQKLRGKTHQVYTGIAVVNHQTKEKKTDFEVTKVSFKPFSDQKIGEFFNRVNPLDKAGAYAIQEMDEEYIKSLSGSKSNVVGLPLAKTANLLKQMGIRLKSNWQETAFKNLGSKD